MEEMWSETEFMWEKELTKKQKMNKTIPAKKRKPIKNSHQK